MSQNRQYITLDSVINDYIVEAEKPNHAYFKLFHLAFRGMEQLGLDFFYRIQSVKLPVDANFTVKLPNDYLNWAKVGVFNDRGEIIPLFYNSNISTYADLLPNRLEKVIDPQSAALSDWALGFGNGVWYNFWNGAAFVNIYGVPSGSPWVGQFTIDNDNGVIVLQPNFTYTYIVLEYVCSPQIGNDYYLPVQFREALIAWLWWKDKRATSTARGQVGISRDLKNDFFNERRNAIARWKPIRDSEMYQIRQEMSRMAVKS